jgi:stage V sporulation protein B
LALADDLKVGINTLENLMVPKRLALYGAATAPLAAFGMVSGMVFPVLTFPAAILFALAELLIPEIARCHAAGSRSRIQYLTKRSLRLALLYGCFCGGAMYLLSGVLCQWLYQNTTAGEALGLYATLVPMLYCDAITDAMNKGLGQQRAAVGYNILTAVLDVVGLYFLLPRFGMTGYFISFAVTHLINFLLSLGLLTRTSGIRIPFHLPALTVTATLAGVYAAGHLSDPLWQVLGYAGIIGSLWVLFGVVSMEDIHWLRGLIAKK